MKILFKLPKHGVNKVILADLAKERLWSLGLHWTKMPMSLSKYAFFQSILFEYTSDETLWELKEVLLKLSPQSIKPEKCFREHVAQRLQIHFDPSKLKRALKISGCLFDLQMANGQSGEKFNKRRMVSVAHILRWEKHNLSLREAVDYTLKKDGKYIVHASVRPPEDEENTQFLAKLKKLNLVSIEELINLHKSTFIKSPQFFKESMNSQERNMGILLAGYINYILICFAKAVDEETIHHIAALYGYLENKGFFTRWYSKLLAERISEYGLSMEKKREINYR